MRKQESGELGKHLVCGVAMCDGRLMGTMNNTGGHILMPPGGKLDNCKLNQVNKWIKNGLPK